MTRLPFCIENQVDAIQLALTGGRPGEAYFILDEEERSMKAMLSGLAASVGMVLPDRSVPYWLASSGARRRDRLRADGDRMPVRRRQRQRNRPIERYSPSHASLSLSSISPLKSLPISLASDRSMSVNLLCETRSAWSLA